MFKSAQDHPRRCGENSRMGKKDSRQLGSPPQVRGKLALPQALLFLAGITPAGAGKTVREIPAKGKKGDHPRRCGENSAANDCKHLSRGSPPQVRGKPEAVAKLRRDTGITPAGAGKTIQSLPKNVTPWDHPRRCGENTTGGLHQMPLTGSPPQVRGKLRACLAVAQGRRITPAGAGKTTTQARTRTNAGSPPQVRGKPRRLSPCSP